MKNHVAFKFLAVLLSAFLLMSAVGSGLGIVILSHYDLYNRTVDQAYEEALSQVQKEFAEALIFRYASQELGRCSTHLIDDYYGDGPLYHSFHWGRYSYAIRDGEGNIVVDVEREIPNAAHYEIPVENGRFLCLISEQFVDKALGAPLQPAVTEPAATEETTEATEVTETTVPPETTAAAEETAPVQEEAPEEAPAEGEDGEENAEAAPEEGAEEAPAEEAPAEENNEEEAVEASAEEAPAEEAPAEEAEEAPAEKAEEAPAEEGEEAPAEEGEEAPAEDGEQVPEETVPPTEEPTVPPTEAPTEPVTEPTIPEPTLPEGVAIKDGITTYSPILRSDGKPYYTRDQFESSFTYQYYDYKPGAVVEATLCFANTADYTVDLYLAHDAMYDYQIWDFLKVIGPFRGALVVVLGLSLLLFAGAISYLCCAAGKKPGSDEKMAAGLNRLPLDLYAVLAGAGILGAWALIAFGYELFRNTLMLQAASSALGCFAACLLVVAFIFAAAAQAKMPDGFWWKNSLILRLLRLLAAMALGLWMWLCAQGRKLIPWFKKLGAGMNRVYTLLPVMGQWILATGLVVLVLCLTIGSRKILLVILGIVLAVAATIYSGYCFGNLLDGVKKMRRGELKTKVDDQMMVGSLKEFAQELNGLADVADTAAQKHLKSERMKTELITNVSHDIKTPLTSIINYVDLMEKPHTEEEQQEYLDVLSRQSQRLKKLIDDLMEMSKASTGNIQTEITQVNAVEAVTQALGEFSDKLTRAELEPVFTPADYEIPMMADGRLVWRVLSNLLGNVVKYALPGTRVYLDITELQEDVVISVKNVSRDALNISSDELMERFVRGDVSRNTEGSGLGLNIAKSLMELQHGQLELLVDGDLFKVTLIFPKM